jgi:hypothetical protein
MIMEDARTRATARAHPAPRNHPCPYIITDWLL